MVKEKKEKSTEEKILAAAKKVFVAKGMAGARMQDIADEAGINKALLHYYFRNKEKLFEVIFMDAHRNCFQRSIPFLSRMCLYLKRLKISVKNISPLCLKIPTCLCLY